ADAGRAGEGGGPAAPGVREELGVDGAGSGGAAPAGPGIRRPAGARPRGFEHEGYRPHGDARGVRESGAVQPAGVLLEAIRGGGAGTSGGRRSPGSGKDQRDGGLNRDRPSVRRDRRPPDYDPVARDGEAGRAVRADHGLRRGRYGVRDGAGAPVADAIARPRSSFPPCRPAAPACGYAAPSGTSGAVHASATAASSSATASSSVASQGRVARQPPSSYRGNWRAVVEVRTGAPSGGRRA